jgi:cytochrome d ubiquinol oxidase subunit I
VGRQPWIVQPPIVRGPDGAPALDADGYLRYQTALVRQPDGTRREVVAGLRTADAVSEVVSGAQVLTSMVLFGLIYLLLGALWIVVLDHKIRAGPEPGPAAARQGPDLAGAVGSLLGHQVSMTDDRGGGA